MLEQPMEVREDGFKREKEKKEENLRKLKDKAICSLEIDLTASKISQKMLPAVSHEEIRRWQSRTIRWDGCAKPSEQF